MDNIIKEIVYLLKKANVTVSTMESCTGGGLANAITNVEGASEVFQFGTVTYSNLYKIRMGVNKNIIDKYSVYSIETAKAMSKCISDFTKSEYAIGITGRLNKELGGENNIVYISIYNSITDTYVTNIVKTVLTTRSQNKEMVINQVLTDFYKVIINNSK